MITAEHLTKNFGRIQALHDISMNIKEGEIFGLVGTNGAGKSTFMRLAAGIIRPSYGRITIDDSEVWDNPVAKRDMCFISDDPYMFSNSTASDMENYYSSIYTEFDRGHFEKLLSEFGLDPKRRVSEYSKGMKKQLAILLAISTGTKYVLMDETFDGLDPVMRQAVKSLFAGEMDRRGLTPLISSHNLRELEDICDHVGLLHRGGLILSENLDDLKLDVLKLQCVFKNEDDAEIIPVKLKVIQDEKQGRLHIMTVRASREQVTEAFSGIGTDFFEILPLSLEEVFIAETEGAGYDVRKLIIR